MRFMSFAVAALVCIAWHDQSLFAQEPQQAAPRQSMAGMLPESTKAGLEHARLARLAGKFDVEMTMGAGPRRLVQKGSGENEMRLGGRFLETRFQLPDGPMPTEGIYTLSFDRRHAEYAIVAMDSFGTYFVTARGKADEKGVIRMAGTDNDPQMAKLGYKKEFIFQYELAGDDEFKIKILMIDTRTEARKEMEYITFTFKRKA